MSNGTRAPAHVGRVALEGGVGGGLGYVVAQFLTGFIPAGAMPPVQIERLEVILLAIFTALAPVVMTALRNAGRGGFLTGAAPLRQDIGVSSLVLVALTGALVLPGITGCQTIEALKQLDDRGAVDLAIDAALEATDEAIVQRDRILDEMEAGERDLFDGEREVLRIGTGVRSVHAAVGAAEIGRRAGDADMDALAADIMSEVANLYQFIRSEVQNDG